MPERVLSEREMIDIMTDVQIIEADINYRKTQEKGAESSPNDYRELTQSYYEALWHYGQHLLAKHALLYRKASSIREDNGFGVSAANKGTIRAKAR